MRNPNFFRNFLILILVLGALSFFGYNWFIENLKEAPSQDSTRKAFVIQREESLTSVAKRLEEEGIIKSAWLFKETLKNQGQEKNIQAGDFKLHSAMNLQQVIDSLMSGADDLWVTLLEGWRVEEIARKLNQELGIDSDSFIKAAKKYEGYLFPDTYLFNKDATIDTIISKLQNTFDQKYQEVESQIQKKGLTKGQAVVLASLVEREARSDGVRQKVASIILKRFKIGMKLDIDATVRYAKDSAVLKDGGKVDKFWQAITQEDYSDVISPYNTYLNQGLPPAPICNPSLSSLKAVAAADSSTPYLYYFHDSKGNSYYGTTLEEHNENVANYR